MATLTSDRDVETVEKAAPPAALAADPGPPLLTPVFFAMCGFSLTVFLSVFLLLPTAPFRILDLGGGKAAAGLFLGFLTYASAFSAPLTGAVADRMGKRRVLVVSSLAIAGFSVAYALSRTYTLPLALALVHGVFWSALLSASAAYMTDLIPESRRAEGIGYWGLSSIVAIAVAPTLAFWIYHYGWIWVCGTSAFLNVLMAAIAFRLRELRPAFVSSDRFFTRRLLEWRVLLMSVTLFLYTFGYGGMMSFVALYADALHVAPKAQYFLVFALVVLATRPIAGRFADRIGHRRIFLPCLALIAVGLTVLSFAQGKVGLLTSALIFGSGFGTAYPVYAAYVMRHVPASRRGAAFGGILAAFDTGIGTGSVVTGWMVARYGFPAAFGLAAALSALAIPYFLAAEKRLLSAVAPSGLD
jgi:MFS family permease